MESSKENQNNVSNEMRWRFSHILNYGKEEKQKKTRSVPIFNFCLVSNTNKNLIIFPKKVK